MMSHSRSVSGFGWLVLLVQTLFGAWFLVHGLNYFFNFFDQPLKGELMVGLVHSGLFAWVKVVEVVVGVLLLAHRFVPLAIVLAAPVTVVVAYVNLMGHRDFGHAVGVIILTANALMALGYWDLYRPMLAYNAGTPGWRGLMRDTAKTEAGAWRR
jgi:uncharacterized membrane protein YphA (DoxX/SURF4 family)